MPGGSFTYNTDETSTAVDSDFFPDGASFIEASDVMALSDVCSIDSISSGPHLAIQASY